MAYGIKTTHTDFRKKGLFSAPKTSLRPKTRGDIKAEKAIESADRISKMKAKEDAAEKNRKDAEIVDKAVNEAMKYKK
jgi:hypothetical protein